MAKFASQERYTSPIAAGAVHPDTLVEIHDARALGYPSTPIRPLLERERELIGKLQCEGSAGNYHLDCPAPVVAVQFVTWTGEPLAYCKEHALAADGWDEILYRSEPVPVPEMTEEAKEHLQELMEGKKRRKKRELEEIEP